MSTAVVLMAYGSPNRIEDVPAYYADIRGGRPIKPEHLEDLVARYKRLGIEESNPLNEITEATRAALEAELGLPVFTGMRHWTPRIAEAVEQALAGGADTIVGLVLAPHYSSLSIEKYRAQLEDALDGRAELRFVERWGDEPGFVALLAERLVSQKHKHVVFTAHSLPARILDGRRSVPRRAARDGAARGGGGRASRTGRSRSRASRRPASRGSGPTSSTTSTSWRPAASRTSSSARSASSPTISRSAGISTSRRPRRRRSWASASTGSRCRTPIRAFVQMLAGLVRRAAAVPSAG